jgi:hypothetical protein
MPSHDSLGLRGPCAALVASLALACGGPALPSPMPSRSAASLDALEAPRATVTRALDEEPPLPGESVEGWPGLAHSSEEPAREEHHHGH